MSVSRIPPLIFPAVTRHTATVIFVHGLGDTGHGWAPAVENWRRRQRLDEVQFILPHAPRIPITANWGMTMSGWYDIASIDGSAENLRRNEDEAGVVASRAYFHTLIKQEVDAGIPADRIVLGGFSQGGAMSLFSGLTATVKLAGIVALSAYLPLSLRFSQLLPTPELNKATPVFMAHGDADTVVHPALGQKSFDMLKEAGYNVTTKIYPGMGHSACPDEMNDVGAYLQTWLPAQIETNDSGKSEL